MASLDVIALDPTVPQLRAPGVGDTYHFCRVVEFQDGTDAAPSITNVGDTNTGIYWPNADELAVSTGGVQRMSLGATTVFNETGADVDFRIEGDTDANLVFVDASTDRVGLGLNNPDRLLDVDGSSKFRGQILITSGEALTLGLQALQLPTGVESTIGAGLSTRTGVAGESIIQFGNNMNTYYTGSVNAAKPGAMIRIDTRGVEPTPGASAYSVFQIQTRAAGVADPNYTVPVQIGAAPQGTFCIQTNGLATFNYGFVVNEGGGDYDTRFEGDTDTHLFFADASTDRIGIGTNAPGYKLDVNGTANFANNVTFTGGTANGVLYLNGSKVATSGSALTFTGSNLIVGTGDNQAQLTNGRSLLFYNTATGDGLIQSADNVSTFTSLAVNKDSLKFYANNAEGMRLTSTGLGIGTSSPVAKLEVRGALGTTLDDGTIRAIDTTTYAQGNGGAISLGYVYNSSGGIIARAGVIKAIKENATDGNYASALTFSVAPNGSGNVERMRLDSSGNLGLGVTPSAWGSIYKANQIGLVASAYGRTDIQLAGLSSNFYGTNADDRYIATGFATRYYQNAGKHVWDTAPSGTAGNTITFTQAMTLDASGNLGVGVTSPTERLDVVTPASTDAYMRVNATSSNVAVGAKYALAGTEYLRLYADSTMTGIYGIQNVPLSFKTNNTERARITSGGYFKASNAGTYNDSTGAYHELRGSAADILGLFSNTNNSAPFGVDLKYTAAAPNGTSNYFLNCSDNAETRATIRSNGGLANYQSNNVDLSDARTKKDITPAASMWDKIGALEIVTYKYNDQTHDDVNLGVIAQQVESVEPVWVDADGWGSETPEDGVPLKTVYTKDITFAAIKALQEAMARIEKLEAEMAALKGV